MTVLTSYFDDSGTHDASEVVVWAGVFGNQYQWAAFEKLWKDKLANPGAEKQAITRFHMTDCQHSGGEFNGWPRAEAQAFGDDLANILRRCALWGCACGVPRKDWTELVKGDAEALYGDAEGRCIRKVYLHALNWTELKAAGSNIRFVFDDRAQRVKENALLYEIFRQLHEDESIKVRPESLDFARSSDCVPLQAADLFAWEAYRHANDVVSQGQEPSKAKRGSLAKLMGNGRFSVEVLTRAAIEKMAAVSAPGAAKSYNELFSAVGKPSRS